MIAASSLGLIGLTTILFLTGNAFAAFPITGVGGFKIEAEQIDGRNFSLRAKTGETELKGNWGQAAVELGSATITGLQLSKNIHLGGALEEYGVHTLDIMISSNAAATGNNLTLGVTSLTAKKSKFGTLKASENKRASHPIDAFSLTANSLILDNTIINTHLLTAGDITIPGLKVQFILKDHDGNIVSGDF